MAELAPDDPRHGTLNGYNNLRCRCDDCRGAARDWNRAYSHRTGRRRPRAVYLATLRNRVTEHGTITRYAHGCRCDECKRASREAKARWRAKVTA